MIKIYSKEHLIYGYCHGYDNFSEANILHRLIPTEGLVLYIPLKENKTTAETGQNLTTVGTVNFLTESGIPCGYFNSSNYITFNTDNLPTGSSPRTISLWSKIQTYGYVFTYGDYSSTRLFGLQYRTPDIVYFTQHGGGVYVNSTKDLTSWHHICMTLTNSNALNCVFYVDGVKYDLKSDGGGTINTNNTTGHLMGRSGYHETGYLSSIRLYNRILTEEEIILLSKEFKI